jgi:hypothetical protein
LIPDFRADIVQQRIDRIELQAGTDREQPSFQLNIASY